MDPRPPLSSPPVEPHATPHVTGGATPDAVNLCEGRLLLDARRLKHGRQSLGLSQEALADLCQGRHLCASIASIKRAEAGKPVLYRTARHLADAMGVPLAELIWRG